MLERFGLNTLSLNIRSGNRELAPIKKHECVTVLFLDDTMHTFHIEKHAKGYDILDQVFQFLDLSERDYFGLVFSQATGNVVQWVDAQKQFKKQCYCNRLDKKSVPVVEFRVKFFVNDPSRLKEEYTRYQFYLQIKRNIFQGKLPCLINTQCLLASYTVQSELGNFNPNEHQPGYLTNLLLIPEQSSESERKITELHKLHRGQLPADAEYNYLEHSKRLDLYGIDLHNATDSNGKELKLGVSSSGLSIFQNSLRVNSFSWSKMVKVSFKRKDFFIQLRRESLECYETLLGFSMLSHKHAKALWKSCVEHHSFFRLKRPHRLPRFLNINLGSKFYYSGRTELQAVQESNQRVLAQKSFLRSPSKRLITMTEFNARNSLESNGSIVYCRKSQPAHTSILTLSKSSRAYDKVTSKGLESLPRKAWEQESEDYDFQFNTESVDHCTQQLESSVTSIYYHKHTNINQTESPILTIRGSKTVQKNGNDLVSIRLKADEHGRFGFNVKGGVDLGIPVQISKVVPYTPADRSSPRICEGDEVVMINDHEVYGMKHDQVINMIRDCRDLYKGELLIKVRPTLPEPFSEEEPLYQYVPESNNIGSNGKIFDDDAIFDQSLMLLSDGLASGSLLAQYELMYRKNPDLAITEAKKPENLVKNRYRDISPYDCTRVTLAKSKGGDYINANYVNMEIPGHVVNRYIATQGPLCNTIIDFWRMVQQESSHLIVMLTTVMESGRQKCYQYWPVTGEELELDEGFSIKNLSEQPDETGSFVFREFLLCDKEAEEQRHIQHMQYLAWPDHCVPSDQSRFLEFTERVRLARSKTLLEEIEDSLKQVRLLDADADGSDGLMTERKCAASNGETPEEDTKVPTCLHQCISAANPPVIVHCSAGIGRTGVLILMDTALALMKAKQPIYPLDIVRAMRDQRSCMVQNVSQYRFVCECIYTAYMKMSRESTTAKGSTPD